jgi:parallel beta-helix repeat protein
LLENVIYKSSLEASTTKFVGGSGLGNFSTIQEAINAANPGDTIRVYDGTYYENLILNKSVSIIGNGSGNTIIDGGGSGDVINITAGHVTVDGFTFKNGYTGIKLQQKVTVSGDGKAYNISYYGDTGATGLNNARKLVGYQQNLYCVYTKINGSYSGDIYCGRSSDNGSTWQETFVSIGSNYTGDPQSTPSIGVDSNGNLYVVWQGSISTTSSIWDFPQISFAKSTDGGLTFSSPIIISTNVGNTNNFGPALSVANNNNLHVVWYYNMSTKSNAYNILYSKSSDNGITWSIPTQLTNTSHHPHSLFNPTITIDNKDIIHIAWDGYSYLISNHSNIYYRKFTTSWSPIELVTNDTIGFYVNNHPCITVDNKNKPHITWDRLTPSNTIRQIYYTNKTGQSWNIPTKISTYYNGSFLPSISIGRDSIKHIAWYGKTNSSPSKFQIVYSRSTGGGWSNPQNITSGNIDHFCPSLMDSKPHVVPKKGYTLVYMKNAFSTHYYTKFQSSPDFQISLGKGGNNRISNNSCISNKIGLSMFNSDNNLIENNTFNSNDYSGIVFGYSDNNLLCNNICKNNGERGLELFGSNNNTIKNNIAFLNDHNGLLIMDSNRNNIINNIFNNSKNGLGLSIHNSDLNFAFNNTCLNNYQGISIFMNSSRNIASNNICKFNDRSGIIVAWNSNANEIKNNSCKNNLYGISIEDSSFNYIVNNTCQSNDVNGIYIVNQNWESEKNSSDQNIIKNNSCSLNSVGIGLDIVKFNKIFNNEVFNNSFGIFLSDDNYNNLIFENTIFNNTNLGLSIGPDTANNYFYYNFIIFNKDQATDPGNNFWNNSKQEGNYWSDYKGLDTGNMTYSWDITGKHLIADDGIGDTLVPHLNLDYYPFTNQRGWLKPGIPKLKDPGNFNTDGKFNLSWNTTVRTIGYILEEDNTTRFESPIELYNGTEVIFNITGKQNGTYYYRVKASNEKHSSPWSNIVDIIVDWPPNIPKNLSTSVYPPGNTLNLSWNSNLVDTREYELEYKNETMTTWQQLDPILHPGFTYNHTGLVDGVRYDYRIQAIDHRDQLSNFSEIISGIPWDSVPPAPPNGFKVVSTTNDTISLNWNPNTEDDLEGYRLFRSKNQNPSKWGEPIGTIPKGTEEYIDTGLEEETTYYYVLTAFDEVPNNSSYSNLAFGTTILGPHGPIINNSQDDFSIPEDTIDDSTIKLFDWFKDINNDTLEFSCEGQNNISVTIFQENGTVILIPKNNWNGQEKIIFYANDTFNEVSDDVTITVTPINDPPGPAIIINPIEYLTVQNGTAINFSAICYDPDIIYGDKLTFNWESNLSNEIGIGDNLKNIKLSPGIHKITLNVSDLVGETSRATVNITVLPEIIPNITEPETPDNDTDPEKRKVDSSDSSIWITIVIVIIIVIVIVIILFTILRKKKSQNVEEIKDDTQEETQQLPQINQPQSNNETKTQEPDNPPLNEINQEQ